LKKDYAEETWKVEKRKDDLRFTKVINDLLMSGRTPPLGEKGVRWNCGKRFTLPDYSVQAGIYEKCPQNLSCRRRVEWKGHGRLKNELPFIKTIYEIIQIKKTPIFLV